MRDVGILLLHFDPSQEACGLAGLHQNLLNLIQLFICTRYSCASHEAELAHGKIALVSASTQQRRKQIAPNEG